MTIAAMATTLALLVTAGVAAWQVRELDARPAQAAASTHAAGGRPAGRARPGPGAGSVSGTGRARPSGRAPAGQGVVSVSLTVAGAPQVQPVAAFLAMYFESINSHDFQRYASLFIPSIRATMQHFGTGYATTTDTGATLIGLAFTGTDHHELAATVTFTSHQAPSASPDHAPCDQWDVTLFLRRHHGAYQIHHPQPGFPQSVHACP